MAHRASEQTGFSLIELIIVVTIVAILTTLSLPSINAFTANARARAVTGELIAAIQLSRGEAAKRGQIVTVCAVLPENPAQCTDPDTKISWQTGWLVFVDNTGDRGHVDAGDKALRFFPGLGADMSLNADGAFISYAPSGLLATSPLSWSLRDPACVNMSDRDFTLSAVGRPNVAKVGC